MQTEDQSLNASRVETIAVKTDVCACVCVWKTLRCMCAAIRERRISYASSLESRTEKIAICKQATDIRRDRQTDGQTVPSTETDDAI